MKKYLEYISTNLAKFFTKLRSINKKSIFNLLKKNIGILLKFLAHNKLKRYSIISSECIGGAFSRQFNLPYKSPFEALFFFNFDQLSESLIYYMSQEFDFISPDDSVFLDDMKKRGTYNAYPIAKYKKSDIEIHFLHYHSREEALEKWNRRKQRIDYNNMLSIEYTNDKDAINYNSTFKKCIYITSGEIHILTQNIHKIIPTSLQNLDEHQYDYSVRIIHDIYEDFRFYLAVLKT